MALLQWNCNGFYSHLAELQHLITICQPYYVCLQETRLHRKQKGNLNGYQKYRKDRDNANIASGGVAIYVAEKLEAQEIIITTDLEAVAVTTHTPDVGKMTICCLYLPPRINITLTQLQHLINQLPEPYIVVGDFNSHNILWGSNHTEHRGKIVENIIKDNLVLLNDGSSTYLCPKTGTFSSIDLSICDAKLAANVSWTTLSYTQGTGHFPIKISFPEPINELGQTDTVRWKIKEANWANFAELAEVESLNITEEADISTTVDKFVQHIKNAADEAIGRKVFLKKKKINSWWNKDCEKTIKVQKKALKAYKKVQTIENLIKLKKAKAVARRTILESKKKSWQNFVASICSSTPPQQFWKKIRNINGKKFTQQTTVLKNKDQLIYSPQKIADTFAQHFKYNSSTENYSNTFKMHKNQAEKEVIVIKDNTDEINTPFTLKELQLAIGELKDGKSPGPDSITGEIIKHLPHKTITCLLLIYNKIWNTHVYPKQWKIVTTVPLLKPGKNKTELNNYRPISMSNCLSKIFQKMVNKRLVWYLEKKNCLSNIQSGFRKGRSTMDNILGLQIEINKAFKNKQHLIAILFDLQKAYDMTWKYHILKTMKQLGLDGNILFYTRNFLSDRKFQVRNNSHISEQVVQENGLPQGEILSVTLFLLAINKIFEYIDHPVKAYLFADDIVIFCKGKNLNSTRAYLQKTISRLKAFSFHQ